MIDVSGDSEDRHCWIKELEDFFLQESIIPEDKVKARKLRMRAARFAIVRGILYRKSFSRPLLSCVLKEEAKEVLTVIHFRVCENHSRGRSLAHKVITTCYY